MNMKVFIYATEGLYDGLHGIYSLAVYDVDSVNEAEDIGFDMAEDLVYQYGLEDEYSERQLEPHYYCTIYKIADDVDYSVEELDRMCHRLGRDLFVLKYCEENPIN
jgi:hypothetical protein